MEESTTATTTTVEVVNQADCYFYYYSSCNKGKSCPYRHEPSALRNETMCVYWLKGSCNKPNCFYRHMEINKPRDKIPCFFEKQPGGCKKLHCPFFHNNVLDQPREEDVAKKNDIILPVKDSEAEYQTAESESKKIHANICAQLRLQRQLFENDDTSDIPSPPLVLRQPIIVPLHDGESDSESLYCPSPQKSSNNGRSTFDAETDWELERLREIQVEEGNILGYSFETEESMPSNRQTIVSSSSSESYEEREFQEYFTEEEIIEEEIVEDVKDAVHRRLQQQPLQRPLLKPSNIRVNVTANQSPKSPVTTENQKVMGKRKVVSSSAYERVARDQKISHSSDDGETFAADMFLPRRSEDNNRNNENRIVKKPSVKGRLSMHRNSETVNERTIDNSVKSRLGLVRKELTSPNRNVHSTNDLVIDLHEGSGSPLRGHSDTSMHDGRLTVRNAEEVRGLKDSKVDINGRRLGIKDSKYRLNQNSSQINTKDSISSKSKLGTSISDSKLIKQSRLTVPNSEIQTKDKRLHANISHPGSIEETRAKARFSLKEKNASGKIPSSANLIIKSLADIRAERGISPNQKTKGDREINNSANRLRRLNYSTSSLDVSLSALIEEGRTGRLDEERSVSDVGIIKIKTLAEIKAEKERELYIRPNKAVKERELYIPPNKVVKERELYIPPNKVVKERELYIPPNKVVKERELYIPPNKAVKERKLYIPPSKAVKERELYIPPNKAVKERELYVPPNKAVKERELYIPPNKAVKRSISPITFGTDSNKRRLNPIVLSNGDNILTKVRKIQLKAPPSNNFDVGSRKLDLKKTPPKLTLQADHINNDKSSNTIKQNWQNSNYISNSSSLSIQDHRKSCLENQTTGIENSSNKILHKAVDFPIKLGSNEITTSNSGNSKTFMKINYTNNCIKEIQKHLNSGSTHRKLSHLDSFIDEDELLGDELHDSYEDEDEEFNEEELLS